MAAVVIRVGTSGWSHDHWHPELYARGLAAGNGLACYAAEFCIAELNASFCRWSKPSALGSWRRRLPELPVSHCRARGRAGKIAA
jgi:uncharacterized protein YecE (DUF72 family)